MKHTCAQGGAHVCPTQWQYPAPDPYACPRPPLLPPPHSKNMIKYGVRRTEKFLPVGSVVTVVGELYRDPLRAAKIKASAAAHAAG